VIQALHVVRDVVELSGGTSVSVPQLARYTELTGRLLNRVLAFERDGTLSGRILQGVDIRVEPWVPAELYGSLFNPKLLDKYVEGSKLVQLHGIWEAPCISFGRYCHKRGVPYIVSAHGMLDAWALEHKRIRKRLYSALFERNNLQGAACLRALTMQELADYRKYGLHNPIAVIGNGVDIPTAEMVDPERFWRQWPKLKGKRLVVFLARLHEKKGVDILIRSWQMVAREYPDWHLVVAGPNNGKCKEKLSAVVEAAGMEDCVTFTGMLDYELKWSALGAAEVFALPSHSEGFSVAVLEALAAGLRVLITPGCKFPELEGMSFARTVEAVDESVAAGLAALMRLKDGESLRARSEASQYVKERYGWPAIGNQMAEVYEWVLGGARPASCTIDMGV